MNLYAVLSTLMVIMSDLNNLIISNNVSLTMLGIHFFTNNTNKIILQGKKLSGTPEDHRVVLDLVLHKGYMKWRNGRFLAMSEYIMFTYFSF